MEVALPSAAAAIKGAEDQPVDGRTLSDTLHAHGVNLRYLGKVRGGGEGWSVNLAELHSFVEVS